MNSPHCAGSRQAVGGYPSQGRPANNPLAVTPGPPRVCRADQSGRFSTPNVGNGRSARSPSHRPGSLPPPHAAEHQSTPGIEAGRRSGSFPDRLNLDRQARMLPSLRKARTEQKERNGQATRVASFRYSRLSNADKAGRESTDQICCATRLIRIRKRRRWLGRMDHKLAVGG